MSNSSKPAASRFIISAVMAFVLSIFLTVVTYAVGIYFGCVRDSAYTESIDNKKYYESVEKLFYEDADAAIMPVGLPTEVLDNIIDRAEMKSQITQYVKASLNNRKYTFDSSNLEKKLKENINAYISSQNISLTEQQMAYKDEFIKEVGNIYISTLEVPVIGKLPEYINIYTKICKYVIPFGLVLSLLCVVMIIKMYTWRHRGLRFIVYATTATAIMTMSLPIVGLSTGFYKKVGLEPEYFYHFFVSIFGRTLKICLYFGLVWVVITALLLALIRLFKKKGVHKRSRH